MNSRFYWKLRYYWHLPNSLKERCKPQTNFLWAWHLLKMGKINASFSQAKYSFKSLMKRFIWWAAYTQPFRCNGDNGGWKTYFCEYLENKARKGENNAKLND